MRLYLIAVICLASSIGSAQINGPSPVTQGQSSSYTYVDDLMIYTSYQWEVSHGTVTSSSRSGITYSCTIQWTTEGTSSLAFRGQGVIRASRTVTVNNCGVTAATPSGMTVTIGTNLCGPRTVSYSGASSPLGRKWYWQTSASGTSLTNSTTSYIASTTGPLYLRARADCNGAWSSGAYGPISVTVNYPAMPPFFSGGTSSCTSRQLTVSSTPPAGVSWYWQGTNANGQLTTPSLKAPDNTYTAAIDGTNTYYIRGVDTNNCWGPARSMSVFVDSPAPPNPTAVSYCEWENMVLTTTNVSNTTKWYSNADVFLQTGTSLTTQGLKSGTYTYKLRNVSVNGCDGLTSNLDLTVQSNCDDFLNWTQDTHYTVNTDGSPKATAASRTYVNSRGEYLQSQSKNYTANSIIANQPLYDRNNKPVGQSMDAPINSSSFVYRHRFITNQSSSPVPYGPDHFDKLPGSGPGEPFNPMAVGSDGPGSLGWYYNSTNTIEPLVPQTAYPYSRTYTPDEPDPKVSYSGGVSYLRMGGTHEAKSERRLITGELDNYFLLRPQFISTPLTANPNLLGNLTTTSISGFTPYLNVTVTTASGYIQAVTNQSGGTPGIWPIGGAIAVTPGKKYILRLKGYRSWGGSVVNPCVTDVAGTTTIATGPAFPGNVANEAWVVTTFTVPAGVTFIRVGARWANPTQDHAFRITAVDLRCATPVGPIGYETILTDQDGTKSAVFQDADGNILAKAMIISGTNPSTYVYDHWSYSYYNDGGQLVASIAPNGLTGGTTSNPTFVTTYKYDHLGRNIEVNSPDQGVTRYVYSTDGKIRFSQNQEQLITSKFSYVNYDHQGRVVESGEYTMSGSGYYFFETNTVVSPSINSVLSIVDNNLPMGVDIESMSSANFTGPSKKIDTARCDGYTYILYDRQSSSFPINDPGDSFHPSQNNLQGMTSMVMARYGTTYYSYDEMGRVEWTKQSLVDLGYKTIDYTYDFSGNNTDVTYQKGKSDKFYHHYTYDTDLRLTEVRTSLDGTTKTLQAKYAYFLHGPLKRMEFASSSCKQGIDYVYAVTGQLKAINSNNPSNDPGLDGFSGSLNASNPKDFFGETLHYSNGDDYTGVGYDAGTVTIDSQYPKQYGGRLQAITYNNATDLNVGGLGNARHIYGYQYDMLGKLKTASWGAVNGSVATFGEAQRENIGSYDKNGNIQSLLRKGKSGSTTANYTYVYEPNTNRLDKITQSGSNVVDYTYNSLGQMTKQDEGTSKVFQVTYTVNGLVKDVRNANGEYIQRYTYDDRGDLVRRIDYDANTLLKTTYFVRDMAGNVVAVYNRPAGGSTTCIELLVYGASRIGMYKPVSSTYLYEMTDHLGNVRAVCELSTRMDTYSATMETENASNEEPPFMNIANTRATYINANHTPTGGGVTGNEVVKLNQAKPAGPALILSVSPGDKIDMDAWAYYEGGGTNNAIAEATMITKIAAAFGGVSGAPGESGQIYNRVNVALTGQFGSSSPFPAAFLTCIVYDKNYVKEFFTSTAVPTGNSMVKQHIVAPTVTIEKPGYVYICLINRSDDINPVYFDDFVVKQTHGPVVAGSDYYPFGLVMDGTQVSDEPYRYGYQGQNNEKDPVSGWNQFGLRMYDARFARWLSPDPYAQYNSPYTGMGNNPTNTTDPTGGLDFDLGRAIVVGAVGAVAGGVIDAKMSDSDGTRGALIGFAAGFLGGGVRGYSVSNINTRFLAGLGKDVDLAALSGLYLQVESFNPNKIWFGKSKGGGNAGRFEEEKRYDEMVRLYLGLNGNDSRFIKLDWTQTFYLGDGPEISETFGFNNVKGVMNKTNYEVQVTVLKEGLRIRTKIRNDFGEVTAGSILDRTIIRRQSVKITASIDANITPGVDPVIGALQSKVLSTTQRSFLPNGKWGQLKWGKMKVD